MLFSLTILFSFKYFSINNMGFPLGKKHAYFNMFYFFLCVVVILDRISLQGLAIRINHHHTALLSFILSSGSDSLYDIGQYA